MFDHHLQRWEFEFVEHVAGIAPEDVHLRRYFHLSSMTDLIWAAWGTDPGTTFANAGCFAIRAASLRFVYAWANAIIDGLAQPFLERFFECRARTALSDTAPAATNSPVRRCGPR